MNIRLGATPGACMSLSRKYPNTNQGNPTKQIFMLALVFKCQDIAGLKDDVPKPKFQEIQEFHHCATR